MNKAFLKIKNEQIVIIDYEDYKFLSKFKWCLNSLGYVETTRWNNETQKQKHTLLHRLIMQAPSGMLVDHVNGNILDNRKINLRICDYSVNNSNRHKAIGNTGHVGVHFYERYQKYQVQVKKNRKVFYQKRFDNLTTAILARKWASQIAQKGGVLCG